jgi:preprotein translocase subunit SecA
MNSTTNQRLARALSTARGIPIVDGLEAARPFIDRVRAFATGQGLATLADSALAAKAAVLRTAGPGHRDFPSPAAEAWLAEVFALNAEFCRRELAQEPFDGQLAAGYAMHRGQLAQLATGEGKTLAAVFPAVAAALAGEAVHLLTANDYLARRDAAWMGPIYRRWGFDAAAVQDGQPPAARRAAYGAAVVYLTAREAGFDYLRDQLAYSADELVQRSFGLAIVDEADLLLIDEARIPLVIAGADEGDGLELGRIDQAAAALEPGRDFQLDPAGRRLSLTLAGERRGAGLLGLEGLHHEPDRPAWARLHAALHARHLVRRDVDYLVRGGKVELVDGFTGRIADKRQWPWGIQAAIEAMEGVAVQPEGRIYGRITIQHFIRLYPRLAAMTATAEPAAAELQECYGLAVAALPPRLPPRRVDEPDRVYRTKADKLAAACAEIARAHARGQPVLAGTGSVAESEELAAELERRGVACQVLNARQDEREAALVARAGRRGMVTVSTNMAGRGTDIRLGDPEIPGSAARVAALGGLLVVGTNRHESRRIDDQLRGRSGRQGDPGTSVYFVSLEDEFFTRYGVPEFLPAWRETPTAPGDAPGPDGVPRPAGDPRFLAEVDRASRLIESQNATLRRSLRRYAELAEFDRRYLRQLRDEALLEGRLPETLAAGCALAPDEKSPALLVRLWLHCLDGFWADHLAWADELREGIHLMQYGGRDPGLEWDRRLAERFEQGLAETIEACAAEWRALPPDAKPEDLDAIGVRRPSSTWTYLVNENVLPGFTLAMIASANLGFAALAAVPVFLFQEAAKLAKRIKARAKRT